MLKNSRVTAFTVFELLRENRQGVKLPPPLPLTPRLGLIYENILKSIATAGSECTEKHKSKASYNTDYIVPELIDFFVED